MAKIMKAVVSLFKAPKMPTIETPAMPDPNSTTAKLAAQKKIAARKSAGRDGTIFGGAYGNANLAGTA